MGKFFRDLIKKQGVGLVMSAVTLDGSRRQVINDRNNNLLDRMKEEAAVKEAKEAQADKLAREEYLRNKIETSKNAKNCAVMGRYT